jgi:predicted Zn-dependent peptidase
MEINKFPMGEAVYQERLQNGLQVVLLPKPGFAQTFVTFTTHYGSVDRAFRTHGHKDYTVVPDGIAHFLEHKMFESEKGDVFPEFSRYGASANAFTTFDLTSYLFSCTDNLRENLNLLLDFVQDPYFTDANVEKEKGIIGQEIQMYNDNPDARVFYDLLKALYQEHPVRIEIAGTIDSIAKITKETLYECYETFYHPGNMVLFAVGGFEPETVLEWIRENQATKSFSDVPVIDRPPITEPTAVKMAQTTAHLAVSQPKCLVAWKDAAGPMSGHDLLERELYLGVVLDALFGRSSPAYQEMMDEGLIDQGFSWEFERAETYGFAVIGGNTPQPEKLTDKIQSVIDEACQTGVMEAEFERCRKKAIGRFLTTLDSPGYVARGYVSYLLRGAQFLDTAAVLGELTLDEANRHLREYFAPERRAVSVVQA